MNTLQKTQIENIINSDSNIIAVYTYGSQVYGTATAQSDTDLIIVVAEMDEKLKDLLPFKGVDINMFEKSVFQELIKEHEISVLECLFLKSEHIWKEEQIWNFKLDLPTLRKSCSAKSSNSWVKAKKKLTVEKDLNIYVGQKSAWHAIRILDFGQQIATTGEIKDYRRVNELLNPILECEDWIELDTKFRKIYNEESSKFKIVAPKEIIEIKKPIKHKM